MYDRNERVIKKKLLNGTGEKMSVRMYQISPKGCVFEIKNEFYLSQF